MMRSIPAWRRATLLAAAFAAAALPATALAHPGGQPFIHVPADHVVPGEWFPVVAADLGPDSTVTIEVATDVGVVPLGAVIAGPDGHFETTILMPSTVPQGYLQISARSDDGSVATVWVQVANGAPSTGPPASAAGGGLWIDPSLLLLLGLGAVAVAAWLIRSRRTSPPVRPRA